MDGTDILIGFLAGAILTIVITLLRRRTIPAIRRRIVENMEDGILVFDVQGKAIDINQSAENILGWTLEEIRGKSMEELFSRKKDLQAFLKPDIINGQFYLQVVDITQTYDVRIAPLTDERGKLEGELVSFRDISKLKEVEDELRHLSTIDPLTNLYNRRYFFNVIQTEIARAKRYESPLALIMIDLDGFKFVNDNYGHLAGDQVLIKAAKAIRKIIRVSDYAVRYGGDEFIILLPQTDQDGARDLAERLVAEISKIQVNSEKNVEFSYGFTKLQLEDDKDGLTMIGRADKQMYDNKRKNGNGRKN